MFSVPFAASEISNKRSGIEP